MINKKNLGIQKNFNHKKFIEKAIQLHKKGEIKKAISIYLKLIKKNKNNLQLLSLIGIANLQIEKNIVGIEYLKKVLELKPNDVSALINIGNGYKNLREHYEAIKYYNKAININHDNADAYSNKGAILLQIKKFEEAIINLNEKALEDYEKVLKLNPNFDYILGKVLHYKMILCDWNNFNLISEKIFNKINNGYKATAPFWLLSISDSLKYTKLSSKIYSENNFSVKINNKPLFKYNNKKPKIAYFSADFYNHATLHLMMDVFKNHDKSKFDIFGFSFGLDKNDEWKKEVKNYFLQFKEIGNISDSDVINLVRDLKIDIAVDLKGFTTNNRSSIFSNRIAPIQINYLGYPGTTAIQNMDYIIADELIIPKKNFRYFSEKVIHLPNCYQPNMHKRDISNKKFTRNEFGLPENGFVYCSFNNNNKITPDIFDTWMNILKEVKNSVLWILKSNEAVVKNLKKEAEKKGVNSNRIIFANYLPNNEHLKRLSLANLFLDTFPCNAHTTACGAIRIGLPLITLMGNSFASRVAASLLKNLEMEELITFNLKDYEKLAIDLGLNSNKFQQIKKSFEKAVSKSSLFDSNKFTLNLENLYLKLLDN